MILFGIYHLQYHIDMENTTQRLKVQTLERFHKHGKMGESFDRVANKVLDQAEANSSKEVGLDGREV